MPCDAEDLMPCDAEDLMQCDAEEDIIPCQSKNIMSMILCHANAKLKMLCQGLHVMPMVIMLNQCQAKDVMP